MKDEGSPCGVKGGVILSLYVLGAGAVVRFDSVSAEVAMRFDFAQRGGYSVSSCNRRLLPFDTPFGRRAGRSSQ